MSKYESTHLELSKKMYSLTATKQAVKGLRRYGQGLDPLESGRDWLQMLDEEIIDAHQYLVAEAVKRKFIVNKIRTLLNQKDNYLSKTEIHFWLDKLEGERSV